MCGYLTDYKKINNTKWLNHRIHNNRKDAKNNNNCCYSIYGSIGFRN